MTACSYCEFLLDAVQQDRADVEIVLLVQLTDARRAGDVDFRQIVADYVESGEQDTVFTQARGDRGDDGAVLFAQRNADATVLMDVETGDVIAKSGTSGETYGPLYVPYHDYRLLYAEHAE